jgi:hypothetical protein
VARREGDRSGVAAGFAATSTVGTRQGRFEEGVPDRWSLRRPLWADEWVKISRPLPCVGWAGAVKSAHEGKKFCFLF